MEKLRILLILLDKAEYLLNLPAIGQAIITGDNALANGVLGQKIAKHYTWRWGLYVACF